MQLLLKEKVHGHNHVTEFAPTKLAVCLRLTGQRKQSIISVTQQFSNCLKGLLCRFSGYVTNYLALFANIF